MTLAHIRSAAAQVGVCDENQLVYDFARAATAATSGRDLDEAWRTYVTPVETTIDQDTFALLARLYSLRVSTMLDNPG